MNSNVFHLLNSDMVMVIKLPPNRLCSLVARWRGGNSALVQYVSDCIILDPGFLLKVQRDISNIQNQGSPVDCYKPPSPREWKYVPQSLRNTLGQLACSGDRGLSQARSICPDVPLGYSIKMPSSNQLTKCLLQHLKLEPHSRDGKAVTLNVTEGCDGLRRYYPKFIVSDGVVSFCLTGDGVVGPRIYNLFSIFGTWGILRMDQLTVENYETSISWLCEQLRNFESS